MGTAATSAATAPRATESDDSECSSKSGRILASGDVKFSGSNSSFRYEIEVDGDEVGLWFLDKTTKKHWYEQCHGLPSLDK